MHKRCGFYARVDSDKVYNHKTIDIEMRDFYGCLRDSIERPLSLRLMFGEDVRGMSEAAKDALAKDHAKLAMHQLKEAVIGQAEQFFREFNHYNFEDMQRAIRDCIQRCSPSELPTEKT